MQGRGCVWTAITERRGTVASSTAVCPPTAIGRIASPSCCHARRPGTTPARRASRRCIRTRVRMPRGAISLWLGIAEARQAVGAGETYRQAGLVARERARRLRADPETGELRMTRHGQLVADWVEVFAPVVFGASPALRMAEGRLIVARRSALLGARPGHGSSARRGSSAVAPNFGASRAFPMPLRPTGRRSCAAWRVPRRGSSATTTWG